MKFLITGAKGQMGSILEKKLSLNHEVYAFSSSQLDITQNNQVIEYITNYKPDIVLNCASYNQVEQAEIDKERAKAVNSKAIQYLVDICNLLDIKLIHLSTDFVFDGKKKTPYIESDIPCPINYYGHTKFMGEQIIEGKAKNYLLIRTSWLYSNYSHNFFKTITKLAVEKDILTVVNDQIGSPTNAYELADKILELIQINATGLFHCSGEGQCSWYDFAKAIVELQNLNCKVMPVSSQEYKQKVTRPQYSVLDNKRLKEVTGKTMNNWYDSLKNFIKINEMNDRG